MVDRLSIDQLAAVFDDLLELSVAERTKSLGAAELHPEDRSRLQRMLNADADGEPRFLDESALMHAHALMGDRDREVEPADLVGQQFGAFRLERLLGQGGMATVFLGKRVGADFDQTVAVKLLRRGLFSAVEQNLFRRERRLLANLSHPNIAHLIDGGVTEAGIPYLVLEFIEGSRLDHFVVERRLGMHARLSLFVETCRAVEAAHHALVVHRDIKPSNILVTADGTPKLLDFGIAKLLLDEGADAPHHTFTSALTPGYAAPEQLAGGQVTTATDVYALGVVLQELLTGQRPSATGLALASSVVDTKVTPAPGVLPLSPRLLRRALRGDLDNIIARALSPEPDRRYPTATALIEDVERFLQGRPVRAYPRSRWYLLRKFVARHRTPVALVAVLSLALLGSLAGALWQAGAARTEAQRANSVRDFIVDLFRTAEEARPRGERATPEDVVRIGSERVLGTSDLPPETRAELLAVLSTVALSMGSEKQATALTDALMELADNLYPRDDPRWIAARHLRAEFLVSQSREAEAEALLAPLREDLLRRNDPIATETLLTLLRAMSTEGGEDKLEDAVALMRRVREQALQNPLLDPRMVLRVLIAESDRFSAMHRFSEGLERGDAAIRYWKSHELPPSSDVLWLYGSIGNAASSLGDARRGEAAYREAIALSESIHALPHSDTAWFVGLLGSYLVSLGRIEEAEPYVLRGLAMRRSLLGDAHPNTLFALAAASRLRFLQKRPADAFALLDEGIAICDREKIRGEACIRLLQTRGRLRSGEGEFAGAEADLEAAIVMQKQVSGENSPMIASQLAYMAELQQRMGRPAEAVATADRALALMDEAGGGHWGDRATAQLQRAMANLSLGNARAALDEISEAEPAFTKASPGNVRTRLAMADVMARALASLGRRDEARQTAERALRIEDAATKGDPDVVAHLRGIARSGRDD